MQDAELTSAHPLPPIQLSGDVSVPANDEASKRLIFCISSGRAGSDYLNHLLGTAARVVSFHEPVPDMSGEALTTSMEQGLAKTKELRKIKVKALRQHLACMPPNHVYAETNHMFIKTFYDVVLESFPRQSVSVVILRRNLVKVLKSFINLGYFTIHEGAWRVWMHRVPSAISAICPPKSYEEMDEYDRIISYLIDIEAKAQAFKSQYLHHDIHEVFLEDLQTLSSAFSLFEKLRLEPTAMTEQAAGQRVNDRAHRKAEVKIETTEEYCRERICDYLNLCHKKGISLPALPQFPQ